MDEVDADAGAEMPRGGGGVRVDEPNHVGEAKLVEGCVARSAIMAAPFADAPTGRRGRLQGEDGGFDDDIRIRVWRVDGRNELGFEAGEHQEQAGQQGRMQQTGGREEGFGGRIGAAADAEVGPVATEGEADGAGRRGWMME